MPPPMISLRRRCRHAMIFAAAAAAVHAAAMMMLSLRRCYYRSIRHYYRHCHQTYRSSNIVTVTFLRHDLFDCPCRHPRCQFTIASHTRLIICRRFSATYAARHSLDFAIRPRHVAFADAIPTPTEILLLPPLLRHAAAAAGCCHDDASLCRAALLSMPDADAAMLFRRARGECKRARLAEAITLRDT